MSRRTRVLLVDDSADIRDLYQRLINKQDDLECVATGDSTAGLEGVVRQHQADVAVVDLTGTGRDPLEAIRATQAVCPGCRIIVFSGHDDPDTVQRATQAGAGSLVSKHEHPMKLIEEIRRLAGRATG
jgi:DNA-binding NarL/FixJ family response regulator